jgi:signal transduction histidine kinase
VIFPSSKVIFIKRGFMKKKNILTSVASMVIILIFIILNSSINPSEENINNNYQYLNENPYEGIIQNLESTINEAQLNKDEMIELDNQLKSYQEELNELIKVSDQLNNLINNNLQKSQILALNIQETKEGNQNLQEELENIKLELNKTEDEYLCYTKDNKQKLILFITFLFGIIILANFLVWKRFIKK